MGHVLTRTMIENLEDIFACERGMLSSDLVRRIVTDDAVVDTGPTTVSLSARLIQQLGLTLVDAPRRRYGPVRLTIQDRFCTTDVMEASDHISVAIGRIVLHNLDLVIDLPNRTLIGNPAHGGEQIFELY